MVYEPPEDMQICMPFTVAVWYWKLMCPTKVCVHVWGAQLPAADRGHSACTGFPADSICMYAGAVLRYRC